MASWADGAVTEVIKAAGGEDHTTLQAFEDAHDGESPTNGTLCTAKIIGVPGGGAAYTYWAGWQAGQNATTRIVVTAEAGSETDGTNAAGDDASITKPMALNEATEAFYIDITNIEFNGAAVNIAVDGGGEIRIAKCLFRNDTASAVQNAGCDNDVTIKVGGCLFKNTATANYQGAVWGRDASVTTSIEVFNCTFDSAEYGIREQLGNIKARNVVAVQSDTSDFSGINDEDYCVSEDETAVGGNSSNNVIAADQFTNLAGEDYTIDTAGVLDGTGEARAEGWFTTLCATDFAGTAWLSPPSVGCFEVVGGAAGWAHKFNGVTSPGKVLGVANASIGKINGVAV